MIFPLLELSGFIGTRYWNSRGEDLRAFFASGAFLLGLLISTAFGLYPLMLPAVNPAHSLTISNTSGSPYGLMVGLVWWILGMLLAMIYFVFTYHLFWGKISLAETRQKGTEWPEFPLRLP